MLEDTNSGTNAEVPKVALNHLRAKYSRRGWTYCSTACRTSSSLLLLPPQTQFFKITYIAVC